MKYICEYCRNQVTDSQYFCHECGSLFDFAKPRESDLAKTYYHGTLNEYHAESIMKDGYLKPGVITVNNGTSLEPQKGKVYITPDIRMATIYAIGGIFMGTDHTEEGYGYIFSIDGNELKDIEPDEDDIGRMIHNKKPYWLYEFAKAYFADDSNYIDELPDDILQEMEEFGFNFFDMVMDGEYHAWAVAGKLLKDELDDEEKLELISHGSNIAHEGKINIKNVWRINLKDIPKIKDDASNIFEVAELVKK